MPPEMAMLRLRGGFVGCVLLVLAAACGSSESEPVEVTLDELPCQGFTDGGVWESAPPPPASGDCVWFLFLDNTTFVFEHPLGRTPALIDGLIAFDEDGVNSTPPSGNVFLVRAADENTVTIRNGQNQTFFLRLNLL